MRVQAGRQKCFRFVADEMPRLLVCGLLLAGLPALGQAAPGMQVPKPVPVPPLPSREPRKEPVVPEPTTPAARTFLDSRSHVSFRVPTGWVLARRDGEISTFHLDARTAPAGAQLRAAANLDFNPYPLSTFAGALFYYSVTPHSTEPACAGQTTVKPQKPLPPMTVAKTSFHRGLDEHGKSCTEARVLTYTALRGGSCLRFDLAVNTFCGGDDSGAAELTDAQLASVFRRMEGILDTVQFTDGAK